MFAARADHIPRIGQDENIIALVHRGKSLGAFFLFCVCHYSASGRATECDRQSVISIDSTDRIGQINHFLL